MTRAAVARIALALGALAALAGCSLGASSERGGNAGEVVSTAMVVTFDNGEVLFVDQDSEAPYFPTLPADAPELAAGNVVRVTGNGIMLESYPGQYPGITSVEVIEEGTPADAEKYAGIVAEIWQPKDPAEPPLASIEYATELAVTSVMLDPLGYSWSYEKNGEAQTVTTDAPHPTQLGADELSDARMDGPTEVTVSFDVEATGLAVTRWSEGALDAEGEPVEVDGLSFAVEPGHRYALLASFEAGEATYALVVR